MRNNINIHFKTALIIGGIASVGMLGVFGWYHYAAYGNWKTLANHLPRYEITNMDKIQAYLNLKNTPSLGGIFLEERLPNGLYELLIAPDKGILFFSPILLLALLGIAMSTKRINMERLILFICIAVNLILYASFTDPWGGWAYGPRYLIPSMAILSLFAGIFLAEFPYQLIAKLLAVLMFSVSSAVALLGALTTNAVPPRIEAVYFKIKYGILFAAEYLQKNHTGSFLYNQFFAHQLSLFQYFLIINNVLIVLFILVLFVVPRVSRHES
ncbi:hypothetical protein HGB07_00955 [Candidatus Roizmanbacteria bacterium]|nr:hypothetical protein [Candidatus Roizmanbacteria bacterium]